MGLLPELKAKAVEEINLEGILDSQVGSVPITEVAAGDVILLSVEIELRTSARNDLQHEIQDALPGIKAIILPAGVHVEAVLRNAEPIDA